MKTIYSLLTASILFLASGMAQNETDALRYSQNFYGGTARSMAMGGAFGALGGDFSSMSLNPAGLGVYRSTEITFTPTLLYDNTSTDYIRSISEDNNYRFIVNNAGFVQSNLSGKDEGWIGVNFAIGYNRLASFNRNTSMRRTMHVMDDRSSSLLDNFTYYANTTAGADLDQSLLDPYYEGLAWETYMLEVDALGFWNRPWDNYYGQSQQRRVMESGGIGEYTFSMGANYDNKLYIGGTFGIHRLRYSSQYDHTESDPTDTIDFFQSFTFREFNDAKGSGYTFKAGLIYRPISMLRLGLAFHLPTFYSISETRHTDMRSSVDPQYSIPVDYMRSPTNELDYWLRTPWKAIGSAAVQLGSFALVSMDYEFMDYREANMDRRVTDYDLLSQNDSIRLAYKATHNIRAGAEMNLGPMYLRAGMAYYGSPFAKTEANADASVVTINGGIGFRSENMFFDLAYVNRISQYTYWLYIPGDRYGANIKAYNHQVSATIGFRF